MVCAVPHDEPIPSEEQRGGPQDERKGLLTTQHVRRAKTGDADSLAWLARRLSPLLLAQARYRLGPALRRSVDPEDLVNDVWAVALPALAQLEARQGRETPVLLRFLATTLLYRVNELARRHVRRHGQRSRGMESADGCSQLAASDSLGVVTRAAREETRGTIVTAIETLDERDREVVVLRGVEQLANDRVAELLGETPNAVSLRYNRALAKLRERLPGTVFDELMP
jgi:RNA polymerase sigma factor (sigma-70 family)